MTERVDTDAIAARLKNATPGPWEWSDGVRNEMATLRGANGTEVCNFGDAEPYYPTEGTEPSDADQAFIAAAPGDIAALLAEVARLRTELDRMTILYTNRFPGGTEEPQK